VVVQVLGGCWVFGYFSSEVETREEIECGS
jgi:hypothetical protein